VDVLEALGRPQISSVLRVRNMLEIVLGALVLIGVFVFWCDVTDSWNKVLKKTENANPRTSSALFKVRLQENPATPPSAGRAPHSVHE
jgi:hypothetical protein